MKTWAGERAFPPDLLRAVLPFRLGTPPLKPRFHGHGFARSISSLRAAQSAHPGHPITVPIRHKPAAWIPCSPSPGRHGRRGLYSVRSADPPPFLHPPTVSLHVAGDVGLPPPRIHQGQVPFTAFRSFRPSPCSLPRSDHAPAPLAGSVKVVLRCRLHLD